MGTVKKVVLFVVGMLLAMGFIAIGMNYYTKSVAMSKTTETSFDSLNEKIVNNNYTEYDNNDNLRGSDAINAIRLYAAENFTVSVTTNRGNKSYNKNEYNVTDLSNQYYIEPTAKFSAKLEKNDNGSVNGITLTQKK